MRNPTNDELFKTSHLIMMVITFPCMIGAVAALFIAVSRPEGLRRYEMVQTIGNETDIMSKGLSLLDCANRLPELRNSGLKVECRRQK